MMYLETILQLVALCSIGITSMDDIQESVRSAENKYSQKTQALVEDFKGQVSKAKLKYIEERQKIDNVLLKTLKDVRDKASKNVDLETANKAQQEIESIESTTIEAPIKNSGPKKPVRDFSGTWVGQWDNSNELKLQISKDGMIQHYLSETNIVQARVKTTNGRSLVINDKWQDFELIRKGDRLIVLGWTKDDKRHPMLTQPDHVAILEKQDE